MYTQNSKETMLIIVIKQYNYYIEKVVKCAKSKL